MNRALSLALAIAALIRCIVANMRHELRFEHAVRAAVLTNRVLKLKRRM